MDLSEVAASASHDEVRHPWETARLEVLLSLLSRHAPLGPSSRVIDIGCGDAFVVNELAGRAPSAYFAGVDSAFATHGIDGRSSRPNVSLFSTLDALPATPASVVLLMDVIEHIEDDRAFLDDLVKRPFVTPKTAIVVTVPAYQSLFSSHDVALRHFRRYSNRTLRARLEQSGLRVEEIGYFFGTLVPLRALQVVKERVLGAPAIADSSLHQKPSAKGTASLISRVLAADAKAGLFLRRAGITVPGLSNYAICRTSA